MVGLYVIGGYGLRNVQIKVNVGYGCFIFCMKVVFVVQFLKNNMQGGLQCRYNNICDVQVEIFGKLINIFFLVCLNMRICYVLYFYINQV